MKKTIYITLALIVITFAAAGTSLACSCMASRDSEKTQISNAYKDSAAIFSGTVRSITPTADGSYLVVTFTVKDTWKGTAGTEITVKTAKDSAMCGFNFESGQEYLVYANGTAADLSVGNCSRTSAMPRKPDIKYLAKLKKKQAIKH